MVILPTTAVDLKSCPLNDYPLIYALKSLTIISFIMIISGLFNSHGKNRETMANTAQAKKRARQAEKSRIRNAGQRSNLRTFVKKVIAAVRAGDKEKAQAAYNTAVPIIDSAVNKGIIHKNKASRSKSRLNLKVKSIA
jgi:small subunit ribosomal protein S20